jgi:hypothetical protein
MQRALENGTRIVWTLAVVGLGPYPVRLLAAYPVVCPSSGFGSLPGSARILRLIAFLWMTIGGLFIFSCVALSVAGLLVYAVRRRPMATALGRPGVAVAVLAIVSTAVVSYEVAQPEVVAASWPTKAMEPLLNSIRTLCESEGACPATLEHRAIAPGVRTLAGRGWAYRSCGRKEFAVFLSQCWSSDCQMFRWTTGKCCSASTPSTVAIDAQWSAQLADEDEAWIDSLCSSASRVWMSAPRSRPFDVAHDGGAWIETSAAFGATAVSAQAAQGASAATGASGKAPRAIRTAASAIRNGPGGASGERWASRTAAARAPAGSPHPPRRRNSALAPDGAKGGADPRALGPRAGFLPGSPHPVRARKPHARCRRGSRGSDQPKKRLAALGVMS